MSSTDSENINVDFPLDVSASVRSEQMELQASNPENCAQGQSSNLFEVSLLESVQDDCGTSNFLREPSALQEQLMVQKNMVHSEVSEEFEETPVLPKEAAGNDSNNLMVSSRSRLKFKLKYLEDYVI